MENVLVAGTATNPGKNDYNEDRAVVYKNLPEDPTVAFFAIYDGHGGIEASTYCQKHLHTTVASQDCYATDKKKALVEGFKATDKKFLKKLEDSGCTANVVLISDGGKKIYCANAGDSRCVLSEKGKAVPLSEDHKPGNANEQKRIKAADHTVEVENALVEGKRLQIHRIDGQIAVSRSIGDGDYKDSESLPQEKQAITCVPDIVEREVKTNDEFLVLACDGLWDVMDNQDVVDFVKKKLAKTKEVNDAALNTIADELVKYAVNDKKSPDNVTAVIVQLPKPPKKK